MIMNFLRSLAFLGLLAIGLDLASADGYTFTTFATGAQQGHVGVDTRTTATLVTTFDPGFAYLQYNLNVKNGVNVTQAHYHCAAAGENGPVVAFLFGFVPGGVNVRNGKLASGRLDNTNVLSDTTDFKNTTVCGVTIVNIASLYAAILKGLIYVNVHTVANPAGEVRGQVVQSGGLVNPQ
jgi:hypothetical protein